MNYAELKERYNDNMKIVNGEIESLDYEPAIDKETAKNNCKILERLMKKPHKRR